MKHVLFYCFAVTIVILYLSACSDEPSSLLKEQPAFSSKMNNNSLNHSTSILKFNDDYDLQVDYTILEDGDIDLQYELVLGSSGSNYGFLDLRSTQIETMEAIPNSYSFIGLSANANSISSDPKSFSYEHPDDDDISSRDGMVDPDYLCECNDIDYDENYINGPSDCLHRKYASIRYYCDGVISCNYCSVVLLLGSQKVFIGDSEVADYQSGVLFFNP